MAFLETALVVDVLFVLLFALAFVFGWNNSGLSTGNLANLLNYKEALTLTLLGTFVGLITEGSKMSQLISGKLIPPSQISVTILLAGAATSLLLLFVLTIFKLPVSLSNCVVGSFAGAALATGAGLNQTFLFEILASWVAVPFVTAGVAVIL
jgi:phosphate/sulfate permease